MRRKVDDVVLNNLIADFLFQKKKKELAGSGVLRRENSCLLANLTRKKEKEKLIFGYNRSKYLFLL